jgi:hypothetical protein
LTAWLINLKRETTQRWEKCEDIGNESNCTKASSEERGRQKFQHPGWWSSGGSEQDSTVAEEHEGR